MDDGQSLDCLEKFSVDRLSFCYVFPFYLQGKGGARHSEVTSVGKPGGWPAVVPGCCRFVLIIR